MGNTQLSLSNMRGLSLACLVLLAGLVVAQETTEASTERDAAETTTQTPTSPTSTTTSTTTSASSTTTTEAPVVILKQVNEINEDGSYTGGYEASDGSFRLETKDAEGNVEGKYGFLENGEIKIVEYSANNSTGFQSDLELAQVNPLTEAEAAPQQADPAFELEKKRHEAVIAFQRAVVEKQQQIAQKNDASAQRQNFANTKQGARRPVFNAANFNPNRPASEQFNTGNFNQDFRDFQQQQQRPNQFQAQFQQNQQFAQNPQQFQQPGQFQQQQPRQFQQQQPGQFQPQQPNPAFQFQQQQQQQQQQFVPQRPQQPAQIPVSQLTREQIALEGFSRDDDQDGQIDPLPAHLLPQQ